MYEGIIGTVECPKCRVGDDTSCKTCGGEGEISGYGTVKITEKAVIVVTDGFWPNEESVKSRYLKGKNLPFIRRPRKDYLPEAPVEKVRVQQEGEGCPEGARYILSCPYCGVPLGRGVEHRLEHVDANYLDLDITFLCPNKGCRKKLSFKATLSRLAS